MSRSDPEFWNRRTSATAIWTNLRWTFVHIWAHGRAPALGIVAVQILLGIQPALLIYITQHLIDTEGRLLENGTHSELLSQEGEYARLWALQAQWYGEGEGAQ